jgi:hypothetical protein
MTLALQPFKNSIHTQEKLRLNLHSLSVSVSELLEYGRNCKYRQNREKNDRTLNDYIVNMHYQTFL